LQSKGPVVYLDRLLKAKKIEAVLKDYLKKSVQDFRILDIGCGNGEICHFFLNKNDLYAVDVVDQRSKIDSDVKFTLVESEKLPFAENFFDIVISNQVVEHLGDQDLHMQEVNRILKKEGVCYMATPNKNSPIMGGHKGNIKVLKYNDMIRLFEKNNFHYYEYSITILKQPSKYCSEIKFLKIMPQFLLNKMKYIFPSNIFILKRKS
jgi:SAM-dependent methyltransferase